MADVLSVLREQLSGARDQVQRLETAISALEGAAIAGGERAEKARATLEECYGTDCRQC